MYFKLAAKNVKKSYRDYFIYFITLMISIALFYTFNSFEAQSQILDMNDEIGFAMQTLKSIMSALSLFISLLFAFLILYANNFLIKRRKKELALYTLLGMPKVKIARILFYETMLVGFISLISGISVGILLSQGTAALSARLLAVPFNYSFVFSIQATFVTILSFALIFVIVGIFSNIMMSRTKLIDLLIADRVNDNQNSRSLGFMIIVSILSLCGLFAAYYIALIPWFLIKFLLPIISLGIISTFGVFYSIAFWIVFITQKIKRYYYRDLNTFVVRQISTKINSTYKMLAVVSLLLLVGFGALSSALNLNGIMKRDIAKLNPYTYSIAYSYYSDFDGESLDDEILSDIDSDRLVLHKYGTNHHTHQFSELKLNQEVLEVYSLPMDLVPLSEYNAYRVDKGLDPVKLSDDEFVYYATGIDLEPFVGDHSMFNDTFEFLGRTLKPIQDQDYFVQTRNGTPGISLNLVVSDTVISSLLKGVDFTTQSINTTYISVDILNDDFDNDKSQEKLYELVEPLLNNSEVVQFNYNSITDAKNGYREMLVVFTYSGLYIGVVFIIICVMVLSLQVLSDASDNQRRYLLLSKLGVDDAMQKKAIFTQTFVYFIVPLLMALMHSYIGIQAVNTNLALGGILTDDYFIIFASVITLVILYLLYFVVTYFSSVRITKERQ